jgi:hypothetical protein
MEDELSIGERVIIPFECALGLEINWRPEALVRTGDSQPDYETCED